MFPYEFKQCCTWLIRFNSKVLEFVIFRWGFAIEIGHWDSVEFFLSVFLRKSVIMGDKTSWLSVAQWWRWRQWMRKVIVSSRLIRASTLVPLGHGIDWCLSERPFQSQLRTNYESISRHFSCRTKTGKKFILDSNKCTFWN